MRVYTRLAHCKNGHDISIEGRNSNRDCRVCNRERQQRPGVRAYKRRYFVDVTCKSGGYDTSRRYRKWAQHGIKNSDGSQFDMLNYDRAYQIQCGRCLICHVHQSTMPKRLVVDHNHKTGVFRGLLCNNCNTALGMAKDNQQILSQMIDYLGRPNE